MIGYSNTHLLCQLPLGLSCRRLILILLAYKVVAIGLVMLGSKTIARIKCLKSLSLLLRDCFNYRRLLTFHERILVGGYVGCTLFGLRPNATHLLTANHLTPCVKLICGHMFRRRIIHSRIANAENSFSGCSHDAVSLHLTVWGFRLFKCRL